MNQDIITILFKIVFLGSLTLFLISLPIFFVISFINYRKAKILEEEISKRIKEKEEKWKTKQ